MISESRSRVRTLRVPLGREKIVGKSEDWSRPSTPFCYNIMDPWVRLGHVHFLIAIAFRRVDSA